MVILSKEHKPNKLESHNSLKLCFTSIQGIYSNFVGCESFIGSNCPDMLALCEMNLEDLIDSCNFSGRDYLPLFL